MKKILSFIAVCALFLAGCGETDPIIYEGEPDGTSGIYFAYYSLYSMGNSGTTYIWADTMTLQSLASTDPNGTMRVRVRLNLFGDVSDQDRPFSIKVAGTSTATEGVHFTIDESTKVLPAGAATALLDVNIVNTPDVSDGVTRYITLELEENEYFKHYITSQLVNRDTIPTTVLTIPYQMAYPLPNFYSSYAQPYWGDYSSAKMAFMLEVMGWTYYYFSRQSLYTYAQPMAKFAQLELQKRANEGNPVREADGSLMQLAGAYMVDYSAYGE